MIPTIPGADPFGVATPVMPTQVGIHAFPCPPRQITGSGPSPAPTLRPRPVVRHQALPT